MKQCMIINEDKELMHLKIKKLSGENYRLMNELEEEKETMTKEWDRNREKIYDDLEGQISNLLNQIEALNTENRDLSDSLSRIAIETNTPIEDLIWSMKEARTRSNSLTPKKSSKIGFIKKLKIGKDNELL